MPSSRSLPRGRHRLSRETVTESQRERILEAIVDLVASHGYGGTTVGGIAAKAGVSRTTFYEQFATKEDCFRAAYDGVTGEMIHAIVAASAPADDPREALAAGIDAYLAWGAEHPQAATTFIVEVHTAGPEALEQRYQVLKRFCEVIAAGTPEVPPAAVMAVITSIDSMAHHLIRQGRATELPALSGDARLIAQRLLT